VINVALAKQISIILPLIEEYKASPQYHNEFHGSIDMTNLGQSGMLKTLMEGALGFKCLV
jgi:hypothetical protein